MLKKNSIRLIIIAIMILLAVFTLKWTVSFSAFSEEEKEELRSKGELEKYQGKILQLGLDLQGGMHVVLEVDLPKLIESLASNKTDVFYSMINDVRKEFKDTDQEFFNVFAKHVEKNNIKLVRYFTDMGFKNDEILTGLEAGAKDATSRAMAIIRNRVDQFGVSEPTIQKAGKYRIIVELAGIDDPERARNLIQSTALLEWILMKDPKVTQSFLVSVDNYLKTGDDTLIVNQVDEEDTTVALKESEDEAISVNELLGTSEPGVETAADTSDSSSLLVDKNMYLEKPFSSLLRNIGGLIAVPEENVYTVKKILNKPEVQKMLPYDSQLLWAPDPEPHTLRDGTTQNLLKLYHLKREADLQGKYISKANADFGQSGTSAGQPVINFSLNNEGAKKFSRITGSNIGKQLCIVLDKHVYMAPVIKGKIPGGSGFIEGLDNINEAKDIAIVLRAGSLPAPVEIIEERTVGPTLGRDSIVLGTRLGLIGFVIIIFFMVIYYKGSGLLADLALLLNLVFVLAVLAYLGATLTLPGIAGLILTVGIAVDNNVLVFERIREELEKGKTVRAAIDSGYQRAFLTILDANVTTIITALILMQFGTGPVRGFAVTLFWGVISSFFTAIFVTRTVYNYRTEHKILSKLSI